VSNLKAGDRGPFASLIVRSRKVLDPRLRTVAVHQHTTTTKSALFKAQKEAFFFGSYPGLTAQIDNGSGNILEPADSLCGHGLKQTCKLIVPVSDWIHLGRHNCNLRVSCFSSMGRNDLQPGLMELTRTYHLPNLDARRCTR
jgi:hypothetical protein